MAKQDDFVRITLRLPPDLHEKLRDATGAGSLNATIVDRLDQSFHREDWYGKFGADIKVEVQSPDYAIPVEQIRAGVAELVSTLPHSITQFTVNIVTPKEHAENEAMIAAFRDGEADF